MLASFKRILRSSWEGMFRGGGIVTANVFIMIITISVITSLFMVQEMSGQLVGELEKKVDVSVYFKLDTPEENILNIRDQLEEISEVKSVEYVSQQKAFEIFTENHSDNTLIMEALDEVGINPFLPSLNIKAFEASQYEVIAGFLENSNFRDLVEKIDFHQRKPVIERIFSISEGVKNTGIAISVFLSIVAMLVAFNSVRLTIYNSKEEIKIQRLVGASNWFIRGPFLVQGALVGVIAAVISFILLLAVSLMFRSSLSFIFSDLNLYGIFVSNIWMIILIQLGAGIGLGVLSSFIAIRRYLKV